MIKNPTDFLMQATRLPAAIEAALPAGAPKFSQFLVDTAAKLPKLPNLPMELPDLPAIPALPVMPGTPATLRYVTKVTESPARSVTPLVQEYTQPIEGVVGTITSRRGM